MSRLLLVAALAFVTAACGGTAPPVSALPGASSPLVSFVFDDGNDTDYLVARRVFAEQGAVACSAVTTDRIDTPGYLTSGQVRGLQDAGWEIMSHTVSHPSLPALSPARIEEELARSKTILETLGVRVANLVYPYNRNDAMVRKIASGYYRSARGGGSDFNRGVPDPHLLKSFSLKHDTRRMERTIDRAHAENSWLIFYLHEIDAKVKLMERTGEFQAGETLSLSPSGTVARCSVTQWFPLFGSLMYLVPLSGTPQPGDLIVGAASGATARIDYLMYDEPSQLAEMLGYIRRNYPDMRVVTVEQALDLLGVPARTD